MLKAQIHWKGTEGAAVECEFAYPLREGDAFVVQEGEARFLCKVESIVHFPVNAGSGHTPSVGYFVTRQSTSESYWSKQFWGGLLGNLLKLK
ncbi:MULTISPECIES: hypothetical protein [unclassified Novosphingobium]|uniref:hypothetical protein n=1 Tax=unclassified Novosphingobium TaxID=2644732 RepID=UPI0014948C4E|nr:MULTISPECIES: hypothetical protein [unclassified Novosphingobium]MBB3357586.1 F420-0:gamma-glutamyl ligase-like protein [Novosphingobium sp. BK256]MBB3373750.1 F420-0:gamma-glutamyl ligase-like protein [Novosphingobium sp. BK280]MBB3378162.1 F420-0:gamma-glutamyl ligase-like protein [Novosphingobium sp. BK258]MBB3420053.1 F420-0:gamma-glutamyl ligase-like protein [Novosphingobium sp. BK267]MBB3447625.1 F420-0:gamma-glutamyl ligase-like protein [Novosphingobium sp. BK352]